MATNINREEALRLLSSSATTTDTKAVVMALLYIGDQLATVKL